MQAEVQDVNLMQLEFPPKTTVTLQPRDQGAICNVKVFFHHHVLKNNDALHAQKQKYGSPSI